MWTFILIGNGWKWTEDEAGPFGDAERMEGWQMGTVRATGKRLPVQVTHVTWELSLVIQPCPAACPCGAKWVNAESIGKGVCVNRVRWLDFTVRLTGLHGNASGCVREGVSREEASKTRVKYGQHNPMD